MQFLFLHGLGCCSTAEVVLLLSANYFGSSLWVVVGFVVRRIDILHGFWRILVVGDGIYQGVQTVDTDDRISK